MSFSPNAAAESAYAHTLKQLARSNRPEDVAAVQKANAGLRQLALSPGAVHIDSALSNISVQYSNGDYIGEKLMPVVTVDHLSNAYFVYDKRARLAYPDDEIGARSSPNELNESLSTANYSCKGYGYKEYLDAATLKNKDAPLGGMIDIISNLNEGLAFRRELRIASILTTSGNYSGNTAALGSGVRWDVTGGDPIGAIQAARMALWNGRGATKVVGFCSRAVLNALSTNAKIVDLFKYQNTDPRTASPSMLANLLGLDELLVSDARKDTANEAQTASYARIWPDVFGVIRVATAPSLRSASFGYTFRFDDIQTQEWFDPHCGTMGGYYGKVTTSEDHKIVAPDTGYLLTTVIG